jgi:phage N-6-adenine-methyltransferase
MLTDERATPQELYDELNAEFHFTCDLAAAYDNYKHTNYYSIAPPNSAFKHEWTGVCFCNPPYSDIPSWLYRARTQVNLHDSTIVFLLPCDGSTHWFHEYVWDKNIHAARSGIQLRFLDKRYKFGGYSNSAKFATIVVVITKGEYHE